MEEVELLPHLFRTEYRKIVSVLCSLFGIEHIEVAEDIVSDTFLSATELWSLKGLPENPTAWLYTDLDDSKALQHFQTALKLASSKADKETITKNIDRLTTKKQQLTAV